MNLGIYVIKNVESSNRRISKIIKLLILLGLIYQQTTKIFLPLSFDLKKPKPHFTNLHAWKDSQVLLE